MLEAAKGHSNKSTLCAFISTVSLNLFLNMFGCDYKPKTQRIKNKNWICYYEDIKAI